MITCYRMNAGMQKDLKDNERKVFEEESEYPYQSKVLGMIMRYLHRYLVRFCPSDSLVINLGCGSGYQNYFMPRHRLLGVDLSWWRLKKARERFREQDFVLGDATSLPLAESCADVVISSGMVEHLPELNPLFEEIKRILKPQGLCLIAYPAEGGLCYSLGRKLTTKRYYESKLGVNYMELVRQEHLHEAREITAPIRQAFKLERLRYLPLGLPSIHLSAFVCAHCRLR